MAFEKLAEMITVQADACDRLGAAFTGGMVRRSREAVLSGGPVATLYEPWRDASRRKVIEDGAPIRLVGAIHDLALSGEAPALAACYPAPGRQGDAERAWAEAEKLLPDHIHAMVRFMAHEPQTNEVGRSAGLLGGFLIVTKETGLPLRIVELGASAGLNQNWDRFRYQLGEGAWGDPRSSVVLRPKWKGGLPPLEVAPKVIERSACDRRPVDVSDPLQRRRLQAYVWPDMPGRLPRLQAAIGLALETSVRVETADAVDFARKRAGPRDGAATVLFHSIFWQYMPHESQAALSSVIDEHGSRATKSAPFAWVRLEPNPRSLDIMEARLTLWPGGEERLMAIVHPHGADVDWRL